MASSSTKLTIFAESQIKDMENLSMDDVAGWADEQETCTDCTS